MMNVMRLAAACALVTAFAAGAQDRPAAEHSEHEQHAAGSAEPRAADRPMAGMQERMGQMREQMARIHATEDPAERERLMHEHMQSMQQHMQMMGSARAEPGPLAPSRCAAGDAECRMEEMRAENGMAREHMRMLDDRLASIEQLLQQMLEHQRAQEEQNAASRRDRRR
jgi:hypothetical protein